MNGAKNRSTPVSVKELNKTPGGKVAKLFLLYVLVFLIACCFLLFWIVWDDGQNMLQEERARTPQECSDRYFAMNLEEKGWWDGPEDYINHCTS